MNAINDYHNITEIIKDDTKNTIYGKNDKLYISTNEELRESFDKINFENKNVLSVAGSCDQAFFAAKKKANHVDLFDNNINTLYLFYLKKWIHNKYKILQKEFFVDDIILGLLDEINPSCEEEKNAIMFWKMYFNNYKNLDPITRVTFRDKYSFSRTNIDILNDTKFYDINLFNDCTELPNIQYDIILISNILECANSAKEIINARENLYKLASSEGIIVSTSLLGENADFVKALNGIDNIRIDKIMKEKFRLEIIRQKILSERSSKYNKVYGRSFKYIKK